VLLSGLFVLDLLIIRPLEDGNGRVARLLTNAMLSEHRCTAGRYVSVEQAIAESADAYYQALLDSAHGWHEGVADPWPWLSYFTSVVIVPGPTEGCSGRTAVGGSWFPAGAHWQPRRSRSRSRRVRGLA
jgi:hypothetical protein